MRPPIRVLLVDDSPVTLAVLERVLSAAAGIEVAAAAQSGAEALKLIPAVEPDVVCTDLEMPGMSGLALTREIMTRFPRPILVVSSHVQTESAVFEALEAGAVEVCPKPDARAPDAPEFRRELVRKVKLVAGVTVFKRRSAAAEPLPPLLPERSAATAARVVAIGASTGGPLALETVLAGLPRDFPLPILCVQHISKGFLAGMVEWLDRHCRLHVRIARPGETPEAGTVYFSAEDAHLVLNGDGRLGASREPLVDGHRPSVTATFEAVARHYGRGAVGVLLTGMGRDGADGMVAIAGAGGLTIAQDEETSVVFGMPREAIARGAVRHVLPLGEIGPFLSRIAAAKRR